jgi:hypothetical protein
MANLPGRLESSVRDSSQAHHAPVTKIRRRTVLACSLQSYSDDWHDEPTIDECIANARESIALNLEGLADTGQPIPKEPEVPVFVVLSIAA